MSQLAYHVVDVFTDAAFAGNPLAVVLDGDGLSDAQMQRLAAEFNLSETTFPLRPRAEGADYLLRIFTPRRELPFAGHPSVGSAWLLHELGRLPAGAVRQECGAGVLPVVVDARGAQLTGGEPHLGAVVDAAAVAAAVGLSAEDVDPVAPARVCGTGLDFTVLPVRTREAVDRAVPGDALRGRGETFVVAYADGEAYARLFAPDFGIVEDPATGSAALAFGVWLVSAGLAAPAGTTSYVVQQGVAIGRPSVLHGEVDAADGVARATRVRGDVVRVAEGRIALP
jgi:trans-2,3-dihydro-3-hydroxyanthranilate isomerase